MYMPAEFSYLKGKTGRGFEAIDYVQHSKHGMTSSANTGKKYKGV